MDELRRQLDYQTELARILREENRHALELIRLQRQQLERQNGEAAPAAASQLSTFNPPMPANTVRGFFARSEAFLIHQNGEQLSQPSCGVEVILHTRRNEQMPCCAEIISDHHYADIGLFFEGKKLVDYDGVFSLPHEVGQMLTEAGYVVPQECFEAPRRSRAPTPPSLT